MARPPAPRSALGPSRTRFDHWGLAAAEEPSLAEAEAACRQAVERLLPSLTRPPRFDTPADCDPSVLAGRLDDPGGWSDIAVRPELSDLLALHRGELGEHAEVAEARRAVGAAMAEAVTERGWFPPGTGWDLSGHLWYPARTGLGWHTNTRVPGWRVYLTWTAAPRSSFFRYRDPVDGAIVTSRDTGFDLRLFHVGDDVPFWHCVWAGAERHSFGYRLVDTG